MKSVTNKTTINNKILVILGPTSGGKTKLAVELAGKFNGEIVGADSRQVYRGLDIGTGKDLQDYTVILEPKAIESSRLKGINQMLSLLRQPADPLQHDIIKIPYHLIDVADPKRQFDLAKYQKMAFKAIDDILKRGKLPILTGGSGLYLQAVVDNYQLSDIKKNSALRKKLEKLEAGKLFGQLNKLAPKIAVKLNPSDKNNKRRLIRYLEIIAQDQNIKRRNGKKKYDALIIGVNHSGERLKERIAKRLILRLKEQNLIGEVAGLRETGLSWNRLEAFGLEYKFVSLYLQKKITYEEMVEKLNLAIYQFSRRQMSWFRRWERQGAKINWLKDNKIIEKLVKNFIE